MSAGPYAAGAAFFFVTWGASALTTALLLARLDNCGSVRVLAAALLFTTALLVAHMLPGVLGVVTRGTVAAAAVLTALAAWAAVRRRPRPERGRDAPVTPEDRGPLYARVLAGLAAAAIAALVAAYYRGEITHSVSSDDMLNFHLPLVARWIQTGSFWPVVDLLPYDTTGNYPQNGDVLTLASVLPWRGEAFARLVALPYVALAGVATYALGRELRADRARAALWACVVVAIPVLLGAGVVSALPDAVMYGTFAAGLVFLVRTGRDGRGADALLAGLGLGIAFGTKWYAVPAAAAMVALLAVAMLVARRPRRDVGRTVATVAGVTALGGGFWLLRNAVESGSPFFPAGWLPLAARSDVGNPAPRTDFPLAHYLFNGGVLRHVVLPDELKAFGVGGVVLLVGAVAAAVLAWRGARRGDRTSVVAAWVLVSVPVLAVLYVVTPNTASGFEGHPVLVFFSARYLVPAAIPAAAAIAWATSRGGRLAPVGDLAAAVAVADGLRRAFDLPAGRIAAGVLAVLVVGMAVAVVIRAARRHAPALAISTAAAMLLALVAGYGLQRRYADHRLRGQDAAVDYYLDHAHDGDRAALAEQWSVIPPGPVYALFGDRLRNDVRYAGLREDGVNKPYRDARAFGNAVRRGNYGWLMVGRGLRPNGTTPAMRWAPAAGFVPVATTPRLALYRRGTGP